MAKILDKFKPTLGQLNELLSNTFNSQNTPPDTLPLRDKTEASINNIQPIENLTNAERSNYNPSPDEILDAGAKTDAVLQNLNANDIVNALKEGKNLGSPTLDQLVKSMAKKEVNPEQAQKPVDETKQLYNELVKKELHNLLGTDKKPVTSAGDVINAFQKSQGGGIGQGLTSLADYLGTAQGQGVLSSLMGAFGNKDMQIAYNRQALRQLPIEEQRRQEAAALQQQKEKDMTDIVEREIMAGSPKNGASFKDAIDIAHAQKQISDEDYKTLTQTPSYVNDDIMPSSTLNKFLEKYLINQRFGNTKSLEDYKQPNRIAVAKQYGENAKTTKQTPSGQTPAQQAIDLAKLGNIQADTAIKTQKASGTDAKSKENLNNLMNLNVRLKTLGKLIDSPDMANPLTGISGWGHTAYRKAIKPNPTEAQFDTAIQSLKLLIPQVLDKTGKRLSNTEINAIERSLPNLNDTYENKKAKYNAVYQQLVDRFNIEQGTLKSIPRKSTKSTKNTGWSF